MLVFATYAAQTQVGKAEPLTTAKAFTTLALMSLMLVPSAQLITSLSAIYKASGCVTRIQKFLKVSCLGDAQTLWKLDAPIKRSASGITIALENVLPNLQSDVELVPIEMAIRVGEIVMVAGSVGHGKTTFLRLLLGETQPKSGNIRIYADSIGYCSPQPWLRNDTIRKNIIGFRDWDEAWYNTVLRLCDLEPDISQMPDGDGSRVGSRGVTLSGGQKHRISLARALYSRCSLLLLDNLFSSLDRKTRRTVAARLFNSDGHIRKHGITVVFASHDSKLKWSSNP